MTDLKKNFYRTVIKAIALTVALLIFLLPICSCSLENAITVRGEKADFAAMSYDELAEYIAVGQYKDLTISLQGQNKGDAVWDAICENSDIKKYHEEHVYYYINQLEGQYKYYADKAGISYEEMLEELGLNEGSIIKEAKVLTKEDMVYNLIVKLEEITLEESEKQALFSKYADKYVSTYGYTKEYVEQNMSDLIYASMLYDKTTEFLILNNNFTE